MAEFNQNLEDAINGLLDEVMRDSKASITDKTKVIDRALKMEAIKAKMTTGFGSDLFDDEPEGGQE